jgi:2-iminobutanoate/2-iminopropanoate deaminase
VDCRKVCCDVTCGFNNFLIIKYTVLKKEFNMSNKKIFSSDRAPKPKGSYSQAVIHGGLLYISGQIPVDFETGLMVRGTIEDETHAVLDNIKIIVEDAGAKMGDVLKLTCYLADMDEFKRFNKVYKGYFDDEPPARSTIQAGRLPLDVNVEIDAIVALPSFSTE